MSLIVSLLAMSCVEVHDQFGHVPSNQFVKASFGEICPYFWPVMLV
jgi:hypothetical protein